MEMSSLIKLILTILVLIFILNRLLTYDEREKKQDSKDILGCLIYLILALLSYIILGLILKYIKVLF
jgi:putative flippase GtrA